MIVRWNPGNAFATKSFDKGTLDIAGTHESNSEIEIQQISERLGAGRGGVQAHPH